LFQTLIPQLHFGDFFNAIDYRWKALDAESRQRLANELIASQPDLILAQSTPTTAAVLKQTSTISIIFFSVGDPVGEGFVASLPRPGRNATGFINMEASMSGKWLELLEKRSRRVSEGSLFCSTLQRLQVAAHIIWSLSTPPFGLPELRRLLRLFTIAPKLNPSLPHKPASRIVALS
jgi:hypothetical protein